MCTMNEKKTSAYGRLWGWQDAEAEKEYVKRVAADMKNSNAPEGGLGAVVAYSQLIEYPDEELQCIQTETWVRLKK